MASTVKDSSPQTSGKGGGPTGALTLGSLRLGSEPVLSKPLSFPKAQQTPSPSGGAKPDQEIRIPSSEQVFVRGNPIPTYFQPKPEYVVPMQFWRDVFTSLTTRDLIFHHREHPDLPPYRTVFIDPVTQEEIAKAGKRPPPLETLQRKKRDQFEKSGREEIKKQLTELSKKVSNPNTELNPWEMNVRDAFRTLPGDLSKNIRDATGTVGFLRHPKIRAQSGISNWVEDALQRAERWIAPMAEVLHAHNMPVQLLGIPLIEGLFQENAASKAKAVGPWQFLAPTGKIYGLQVTSSFDERKDPVLATDAAAKYFEDSSRQIAAACASVKLPLTEDNLWPLNVTGFNRGIGGITKLVRNTKSCDLGEIVRREKDDKFDIAVKSYWPEFLAAVEIFENREKYFSRPTTTPKPVDGNLYRLTKDISVKTLQSELKKENISYAQFLEANPAVAPKATKIPKNGRIRLPEPVATKLQTTLNLNREDFANPPALAGR